MEQFAERVNAPPAQRDDRKEAKREQGRLLKWTRNHCPHDLLRGREHLLEKTALFARSAVYDDLHALGIDYSLQSSRHHPFEISRVGYCVCVRQGDSQFLIEANEGEGSLEHSSSF